MKMKTSFETKTNHDENLQRYVTDMRALEQFILDLLEQQSSYEEVKNNSDMIRLFQKIKAIAKTHITTLNLQVNRLESQTRSAVKDAVSSAIGTLSGLISSVRKHEISKMVRDDYTVLTLASMGYGMLHTTGLLVKDGEIADFALEHLKNYSRLVIELGDIAPFIVAQELAQEGGTSQIGEWKQAAENIRAAWKMDEEKSTSFV